MKTVTPIEYIEYVMDQMNFKQIDLVRGGCGQRSHVSEMVNGKRPLTLSFIKMFLELTKRKDCAHFLIWGITEPKQSYKINNQ